MLLSTQTHVMFRDLDAENAVDIFAASGYDALDFSFFDPNYYSEQIGDEYFLKLKEYAKNKGLIFNQAHAPFASSFEDKEETENRFSEIVRSMKYASILGVKNIVVHPCKHLDYSDDKNKELLFEINMDFYKRLEPYCEKYNIRVALENMWRYDCGKKIVHSVCGHKEEFVRYIDSLNSEWFIACLDVGHATLVCEDLSHIIKALGKKRLKALHVHDVDGIVDSHTLPYFGGVVNWEKFTKALFEIGYEGEITLEADNFLASRPLELYPQYASLMADTAKHLIKKIESFKK